MDALSPPPPPSSKRREGGSIIKSWRGSARNRAFVWNKASVKSGNKFFFSFREAADQNRGPHPSIRMLPRRDDTRARIRADEIPWLLSGGTRFKIYPRRVAFAIPKRRGAVWIRWVGRPGRQLDRAWGINTSFKYRAGSTKLCYWPARFNAGYMIRFRACYTPLNLLEVFIYTYSSKYDFGRSKMGWSLIGGLRGLGPSFRE